MSIYNTAIDREMLKKIKICTNIEIDAQIRLENAHKSTIITRQIATMKGVDWHVLC